MKRKEKPLTPEELKAKLIQQSLPNWLHSEPHLELIPSPEGIRILPLSSKAESEILVVFLIDLTRYSFEIVMESIERLSREYKGLPWKPVLVTDPKYLFLKDGHFYDRFRSFKTFASVPLLLDARGSWFDHFKVGDGRILLLRRGIEVLQVPLLPGLATQISEMERALQDGLRLEDPGLPLFPIRPQSFTHASDSRILEPRDLTTIGTWMSTPSSILTEDSNAQITFPFEGTRLRLVANSHPNSREPTRFVLTLNQEPLPSAHYGSNMKLGEKGSSVSEVGKNQGLYELISATTPLRGEVRIRFLNAVENPVILYGTRAA